MHFLVLLHIVLFTPPSNEGRPLHQPMGKIFALRIIILNKTCTTSETIPYALSDKSLSIFTIFIGLGFVLATLWPAAFTPCLNKR